MILGLALVGIILYQFVKPEPRSPRSANPNANRSAAETKLNTAVQPPSPQRATTPAEQEALMQQLLADQTPLDLSLLSREVGTAKVGDRGSIFAYYVKPPPPKIVAPPPPIAMQGLQPQTAVAGTPRQILLTVTAGKMPPDAAIYFDGSARPTKRAGENQLTTEIQPAEYSSQGTINVEVRSISEPAKLYSAPAQFIVQAAPEPPLRYIARLGSVNQPDSNYGVFEMTATKEIKRVKRGEIVANVWRIDSINADSADFTHLQYEIKKRIPLQEKPR
jgi:hypothetical protein